MRPHSGEIATAKPSVLVVDDDVALAENLAEIIESLDVEVEAVASATAALARAKDKTFDVVLVDVRLPDGRGTNLVEPIRAGAPHTEVVLITGDATVDTAVEAVRMGAFAYVLKPCSPPELLETVRRALGQAGNTRERERLRRELERSERKHRELIEAVPAFVLALDAEGRIAFWNRQLEEATKYGRDEMLGQPGAALIGSGGVRPLAVKGGRELQVRWKRASAGLPAGAESWTYAVGTDVTGEEEMLRRTLRSERLAAVGTLAAGLAHEVRNPLNSAALQLQVLRRRLARGAGTSESTDEILTLVDDEIRRLERMVSEFLSFAHPRPLSLQPMALAELCQSVLTLIVPEADATGVRVSLAVEPELPVLQVDPERLRQVLQNLVRNAIEAMPTGGTLSLRICRSADGQSVDIDIADTGAGFSDEAPVFDAFFTTKPKGTGLGLAIVHRIVSDHGGTVRVRSQPGDTCFTVSLPTVPVGT